jgi:hypothetical protein
MDEWIDITDMYTETRRLQQIAIEKLRKEYNQEIRLRWWFEEKDHE